MAMTSVGIESMNLYAGPTYVDVRDLFTARGLDLERFDNLMMRKKSVALPCEDAVSYAVNAAKPIIDRLTPAERSRIGTVITCTESPVDFAKSLSTYIHALLGLDRNCRSLELKQACYAGMGALQLAAGVVGSGFTPGEKVLVIATDTARATARNTYAEPTQAAGAIAMLIGDRPRLLDLDPGAHGCCSYEIMDVHRPLPELETGDPDMSLLSYLDCLENCFRAYAERVEGADFQTTFDALAFHTPFAGMVKGAHRRMMRRFGKAAPAEVEADFIRRVAPSLHHCVEVGNIYAGTVFMALCGEITAGRRAGRIGLFSYGSGCSSEFLSGLVPEGAAAHLDAMAIDGGLARRLPIDVATYDRILDLNDEWRFGIKDKEVDTGPYADLYDAFFAGRGLLRLKRVSTYHREYEWS
ncbi:hydroxymethylglutaryl-CoA synthase family protein [Azospirillum argentinense]|uniref:hydroxymethylglutaryl-CoA synthase family protein n=1 Tax=Azospirillum argentinense TaxID=2970906 RepID=UPI001FFEEF8E|nr:hydroxymethylglutaryl-CoA synthase [Azospirillum argentinense]